MPSKLLLFLCLCLLLSSTSCAYDDIDITKVIEELKAKLKDSLGDTDLALEVVFRMIDASSKIPNGLAVGNTYDFRNFDECYNIQHEDVYGKYCLGVLNIDVQKEKYNSTVHLQPKLSGLGLQDLLLYFAVCVPSTWSAAQIPISFLLFSEDYCYSKATEPALSTGAMSLLPRLHCLMFFFTIAKKSSTNPEQLLCLNGIKAISLMWVVFGHEYSTGQLAPMANHLYAEEWEHNVSNMFVMGATVSVDTFFVVGELVTVYTFLKSRAKGVKFNLPLYYVHRYLRLTPALLIMSLIHLYLLHYFGTGPLWKLVDELLVQTCETGWWSTLLYITNYVKQGQTWYLSIDMQLFVLSPFILIPLAKWPKVGLSALGFLAIGECVVPFAVGYSENLGTQFTGNPQAFNDEYYVQTYTRFGPYVIGVLLGFFMYKIKKSQVKIHQKWEVLQPVVCTSWLLFLTGLVACVYAHPLDVAMEEGRWGSALFLAFSRPAWAVAVSGIIFLCVAGYGGPVDGFLSLPIFQFLTKLTYSMYLIHPTLIIGRNSATKFIFRFSNLDLMHRFWGDFMFTLILSLILCLSYESPVIILEKYLFGLVLPKHPKKPSQV